MIKNIVLLLSLTFLSSSLVFAGIPESPEKDMDMDKGFIHYSIVDVSGGGMQAMAMKGTTQAIYFNEEMSLIDMSVMGGIMRTRMFTPADRKSATMIMDGLMGQLKVNLTEEDLNKKEEDKEEVVEYLVKYDRKETKEIAGYTCFRAEFQDEDGIPVMEAWLTEELPLENSPLKKLYPELEGFPLEYQILNEDMLLTYQASVVSKKIPKGTFDIPSKGYKEMTMEEFEEKMGKMQGMGN